MCALPWSYYAVSLLSLWGLFSTVLLSSGAMVLGSYWYWGCRVVITPPRRPRRAKNKRGGVHLKPQPGGVVLLSLSLWTSLSLVILLSSLSLSLSIISLPFPLPISLLAVYVARALDVRLAVIAVSCFLLVPLSVGWTLFGV